MLSKVYFCTAQLWGNSKALDFLRFARTRRAMAAVGLDIELPYMGFFFSIFQARSVASVVTLRSPGTGPARPDEVEH